MADEECTAACKNAYDACVQNASRILVDCLVTADTDAKKAQCQSRFERGMKLCKEAREICLQACEG